MAPRTALPTTPGPKLQLDPETGKTLLVIDWQELALHNTAESCWIAVRDKVYDVTPFLKRHPGGIDTLLYGAGRDSTLVVETYHSLGSIDTVLAKFLIGFLSNDELPTFPLPNEFHRTLKDRVEERFLLKRQDSKNPGIWVIARYLGIYLSVFLSWGLILFNSWVRQSLVLQSVLSLILGFACAQIGLHPLHDASHFAITHNPSVWKWIGASHDFLNGSSYLIWVYQHMLGHHPYTNIPGADPDIATSDPDIRRIQPSQTWLERYIGQEKFVPFLYGILAWKTRVQDILILYVLGNNDSIRINPPTMHHHMVFWGGKAFFVFYRMFLPVYVIGWQRSLLCLVLSDLVSSYWLALTFQVNHVVDNVEFLPPPSELKKGDKIVVPMDWAEMQLKTTQDYAHHSSFWTWMTGGLNYQAVHHVFPHVHQAHYPDIAATIEACCKEYNVEFICQDTFTDAFNGHINHLRGMGLAPSS